MTFAMEIQAHEFLSSEKHVICIPFVEHRVLLHVTSPCLNFNDFLMSSLK